MDEKKERDLSAGLSLTEKKISKHISEQEDTDVNKQSEAAQLLVLMDFSASIIN